MSSDLAVTATSTRDVAAVDTGTRRWPRRALAASWLVALPLVFLGYGLAGWLRGWALGADSSVYRAGAALLLHGHSPYVISDLGYLHLSFTYPPAAALLFTPLAALPAQLAWAVIAAASALALALAIRVAIAAVPYWRFPAAWSTPLLTAAMLCLVPVWRTIALGQVNVLLMAMVAVDVLAVTARGSRWGGLLTGVVFQTGRIGAAEQPYNQSLDGLITRVTGVAPWSAHAAWPAGAVLAVPALLLVLRCHRRGQDVAALCVTACFGLLLAPVSWMPCWVWIAPALITLFSWLQVMWRDAGWERWAGVGAVIAVIAVFASTYSVPISEQRHRTLSPFWFFVLSNPYVLTAIAMALALLASNSRMTPTCPRGAP
jgi:alpha-1,2-mannosyltransferase